MPVVLPGLFDLVSGTNSAINQNQQRLATRNQVTDNFINSLNAFNQAQNTDDNLQLRRLFQESQAPTQLGRLDDVFANANNPFTAQQALVANQQLAPLLAQRTLQNPLLNQGVPQQFGQQLNQGFFGVQPILDLNTNNQIQNLFAQTPALNTAALSQGFGSADRLTAITSNLEAQQARLREAQVVQQLNQALAEIQRLSQLQSQPGVSQPPLITGQFDNATTTEVVR